MHLQIPGAGGFHNPGLWLDLEWTPTPLLGLEDYTGVYYLHRTIVVTNVPGAKIAPRLAGGRIVPFAVAGFGLAYYSETNSGFFGSGSTTSRGLSAAARYGLGTDVQVNRSWGVRAEATKLALHSTQWTNHWNLAGGVVFSIF